MIFKRTTPQSNNQARHELFEKKRAKTIGHLSTQELRRIVAEMVG